MRLNLAKLVSTRVSAFIIRSRKPRPIKPVCFDLGEITQKRTALSMDRSLLRLAGSTSMTIAVPFFINRPFGRAIVEAALRSLVAARTSTTELKTAFHGEQSSSFATSRKTSGMGSLRQLVYRVLSSLRFARVYARGCLGPDCCTPTRVEKQEKTRLDYAFEALPVSTARVRRKSHVASFCGKNRPVASTAHSVVIGIRPRMSVTNFPFGQLLTTPSLVNKS